MLCIKYKFGLLKFYTKFEFLRIDSNIHFPMEEIKNGSVH